MIDQAWADEFCTRWLAAWTGGAPRVEELLSFYAPDARYVDPSHPAGIQGSNALRAYLTRLLSRYPAWTWTALEVWPAERGFTLKWRASLGERTCDGLDLVEIADGRITRNEVYFDPRQLFPSAAL